MASSFVAGALAGYAIAIPVGAIAVLIVELGIRRGFRIAASAGAGAAAADGLYATLAVIGGTAIAVILEPPKHEGIEITKFSEDRMVLISNPALGFKRGDPLQLAEVAPLNLVVPSPNHVLRKNIERHIWTKEIPVSRILEMDSVHGMIDFVCNSKWATILPLTAVLCDIESERVCINPIIEPYLEADLYLINLRQHPLTAAARIFVETLRGEAIAAGKAARAD